MRDRYVGILLTARRLCLSDVKKFIPARNSRSRKGDNGTVLVVGGSYVYHGAPVLASLAALRSGTDLVYTSVPKTNVSATRSASLDIIVIPLADQKLTRGAVNKLVGAIPKGLDSAAIGMGLAVQERNSLLHLVKSLLDCDVRLLLDAGALIPQVLPLLSDKNVVITPHAGEFKRLFGMMPSELEKERISTVEECSRKYGITILLKGPVDIISDGSTTFLNTSGTPAMTVGGTGDVLSGLAAGLLAKNRNTVESAAAAAFVNGLAGKAAHRRLGLHLVPTDMVDMLPEVMMQFDRTIP